MQGQLTHMSKNSVPKSGEWDKNLRLKRIEKEIIKEPFSQSQDDIDADHHHDVGDLIISTDQSYYVEDILYCEGKEDDQRILLPDTESFSKRYGTEE